MKQLGTIYVKFIDDTFADLYAYRLLRNLLYPRHLI